MKQIKCQFDDLEFVITTFKEKDYKEQVEHIKKYYIREDSLNKDIKKVVNISYITDEYYFNKYFQECRNLKGKFYQSFDSEIHKEIKLDNGTKIYLINTQEYLCIKENNDQYTIITDGRKEGIKWPFRLVREILVREKEENLKFFMHGTGIILNDKGILLLGNSGSGKTTLATNLLLNNFENNGFISNDRVFLDDKKMDYFPIPVVLAGGTVKNNNYLTRYFKENKIFERKIDKKYGEISDNTKVAIPLVDIEKIFERTKLTAKKDIDIIVFPKINKQLNNKHQISEMSEREKFIRLDSTCFTPFDSESLRLEWIRKRNISIEELAENKFDTFQLLMKDKKILKLEYGFNSNNEEILEELLR